MKVTTQTVGVGGQIQFGLGNYFRLLICPNPVTVILNGDNGTPVDEFDNVTGGIGFAALDSKGERRTYGSGSISSPTAQTITFGYGFGDISYDISQGTVNITQPTSVVSTVDVTVLAANAAIASAAAVGKRETLISNLSTNTSVLRVGGLGTSGYPRGIEIGPGQTATISGTDAVWVWNASGATQYVGVVIVSN